jgi:heptosyltransferase-2
MIGANKRAGVKYLRQDLLQLGFLNNSRVNENDLLHNVEENIRLSEKLLGFSSVDTPDLTLPLGEDDRAFAKIYFDKARIDDGAIVIGFHAGSATFKNQINRRWDPQKFAELARLLVKNRNAHVLVFGGPEEKTLITEIAHTSGSKQVLVPPSSTIIESASLMKRCNAFVTNDSGMMHLAAALKLPTVAIIGPTNTNYIHPWHTEYEVASLFLDCSPCFVYSPRPLRCSRNDIKFKCIKELTAETVFQRVIHLLDRS